MATKTYPIGTKIIFVAHQGMCYNALQDNGKEGEVIGTTSYGKVRIRLLESAKNHGRSGEWVTKWCNIKPIRVKGQQLLFSFMER